MPNFEVLDARIASALNKIIHNSHFKSKISLEEQKAQKEDRFLRGRQIAYLIYEQFRVTGTDDSVENYTDLFTIVLRNDDIQEFDSKWDGILLSMTKIPPDDILEGLYKQRIREFDKLKTVLELYDLETHQKKLGPDCHRLKAMVKRSIEQNIRNKNFGARNGNYERSVVVKNQGTKQRGPRIPRDCWPWRANGQCSKGDNSIFCHDVNDTAESVFKFFHAAEWEMLREPEMTEARVPVVECLDGPARITSKELAPIYSVKRGTLQNACSTRPRAVADWVISALMYIARLMNSLAKRSQKNDDKSAVAMLKKSELHDRTWKPVAIRDTSRGRARTCWSHIIEYTAIGLRISGHDAAEVYSPEGHRHAEANPTCEIHKGNCTSHQNSRPKSFARLYLPRWTSSA